MDEKTAFLQYLDEIRQIPKEPKLVPALKGKNKLTDEQKWEREFLRSQGSVFKAVKVEGEGSAFPEDDLEILIHFTARTEDDRVLSSSRSADGGTGVPYTFLLGKHCKELYGVELGIRMMRKAERSVLKIKGDYAYDHPTGETLKTSPVLQGRSRHLPCSRT
eukprot:5258177-Pyramimonas_sp.AAC.2